MATATVTSNSRKVRALVTTEQLKKLVDAGVRVKLPKVAALDPEVAANYSAEDLASAKAHSQSAVVTKVEYKCHEPVQCIRVADPRHLYLTDDFIPTHNTANIIFLKSVDDTMIETLTKMSGTRHRVVRDSKTVTQDSERLVKQMSVEGKVSYTMSAKEEAVITYNDLASLSERNSIIFSAGFSPIWNRNAEILPMSWRLFKDTIVHPGHDYSLQTIPTLSSALDFDVRLNQPDFKKMLDKRMQQAAYAKDAMDLYQKTYGFSEHDIELLDPDVYSEEIMSIIGRFHAEAIREKESNEQFGSAEEYRDDLQGSIGFGGFDDDLDNPDVAEQVQNQDELMRDLEVKRYAEGLLSRGDLVNISGAVNHQLDNDFIVMYKSIGRDLAQDSVHFSRASEGGLRSSNMAQNYITLSEDATGDGAESWVIHDEFYRFLANLDSWEQIGGGKFDAEMARIIHARMNEE